MIKISCVSYINTKPFIFGLINSPIWDKIQLSLDVPAICANKLLNNEVDLALVPVAILNDLPEYEIISDFCIGTNGKVKTVAIISNTDIENITDLYLDYQSRTSVELTKILLHNYWKTNPRLHSTDKSFSFNLKKSEAALVIGDRAISKQNSFKYFYDLGEIWKTYSGLPFVFAAWVSTKKIPQNFINDFNQALFKGIEEIPKLKFLLNSPDIEFDLNEYFTRYIDYNLDNEKKKALKTFLSEIRTK